MNPPSLLQRILGVNAKVRTIVLGLAASYAVIRFPVLLTGLPDDLKQAIFGGANEMLHWGVFVALWFLKQSNVTGNGTVDAPAKVAQTDGTSKVIAPLVAALLIPALAFNFTACTTAQLQTAETIAAPIAEAAVVAAAAYYGVPPSDSTAVVTAVNSLWGAYQQVQAGQPAAAGASVASVGQAIQSAIPANTSPAKAAAALQAAANSLSKITPSAKRWEEDGWTKRLDATRRSPIDCRTCRAVSWQAPRYLMMFDFDQLSDFAAGEEPWFRPHFIIIRIGHEDITA